jgi:hypothetical protein
MMRARICVGADRVLDEVAEELSRRGHEVVRAGTALPVGGDLDRYRLVVPGHDVGSGRTMLT